MQMFSRIRKRVTYANVALTAALVFAMSGGAFAAGKYLITSTKQISPKVLKSLKGASGKNGANGANGAAGPAGPAGPAGATGPQGPKGETGAAGTNGTNGETGKEGKQGTPGTTGYVKELPSKATETGVWSISATGENEANTAISFTIPLAAPLGKPEEHKGVHYVGQEGNGTTCPGNLAEPAAQPGNLCVYQGSVSDVEEETLPSGETIAAARVENPTTFEGIVSGGSAKSGALLHLKAKSKTEDTSASGTWAVTAE